MYKKKKEKRKKRKKRKHNQATKKKIDRNDIGNTIKKKEETHRMADANKAFAHFRY